MTKLNLTQQKQTIKIV